MLARAAMGALAGAAGLWVMDRVTWARMIRKDTDALDQEHQARPEGLDPMHLAVQRLHGPSVWRSTPSSRMQQELLCTTRLASFPVPCTQS
jgi:hypothetical protein